MSKSFVHYCFLVFVALVSTYPLDRFHCALLGSRCYLGGILHPHPACICLPVCLPVCMYLPVCLSVYCSAYTGRSCKFSSYTLSVCLPVCLCLVYLHRQTGYTVRSQEMAVVVVLMPHSTLRYRDHTLYSTQYKIYIEVV